MKRVLISVSNDLSTDNRVDKVCRSLLNQGFDPLLIGRCLPDSLPLNRLYATKRLSLWFNKGPLFYAELNLRLFFYLIFKKAFVLHANDLDTLPAMACAALIKRRPLIYDSHEYFTGTPEVEARPWVKAAWLLLERCFIRVPRAHFTVNESIAALYRKEYGLQFVPMRNIPEANGTISVKTRNELGLPADVFMLLIQGSGINIDRGCEQMMEAMLYLPEDIHWLIIGGGDALPTLRQMVAETKLAHRVHFKPRMPYHEMMAYAAVCDLGLSLDKGTNLNYQYSLPNKLFDYMRAGIPVFASRLTEIEKIVQACDSGWLFDEHHPKEMAKTVLMIKNERELYRQKKQNAMTRGSQYTWEKEVEPLLRVYSSL